MQELNILIVTKKEIRIMGFSKAKDHLLLRELPKEKGFFIVPDGELMFPSDIIIYRNNTKSSISDFVKKYSDDFACIFLYTRHRYVFEWNPFD